MKKRILTIVVSLLAMVPSAFAYDFSVQVPSGQTLYFNITGPGEVEVTSGDICQEGNLDIPASIDYENTTYNVTSVGDFAFYCCSMLTSVTIPHTVSSIMEAAFHSCSGLTVINIPSSVTSIACGSFQSCSGLTSISVENGNTVYDSRGNCNAIIETATNSLIAGCMNTVIPNSVSTIQDWSFEGCVGLTSISIPSSVSSIRVSAFYGCTELTSIECLAEMPPTVDYNAFYGIPNNIPVYVPCGKVVDYQLANSWNSFTNIQEIAGCTSAGAPNVAIYADGNDVVVEGADGNTVTLYNNAGNLSNTSTAPSGTPLRFEGLASGTYYVKIGVLPARMKVEVR